MKKTLLSVLAGLAVITSASAGIKETCLENPDKLFWVEASQACIPVNPCEEGEYRNAYCERAFAPDSAHGFNFQMEDENVAYKIAKNYIKEVYGYDDAKSVAAGRSVTKTGQDHLAFSYDGGKRYVQFEFDDITEYFSSTARQGTMNSVAKTYVKKIGKNYDSRGTQFDNDTYTIKGLPLDAGTCEQTANFINSAKIFNGNVANFNMIDNKCEIQLR